MAAAVTRARVQQAPQRIGRFTVWRQRQEPRALACSSATVSAPDGKTHTLEKELTVGSEASCHIQLSGDNIDATHARLTFQKNKVFARALRGAPEDTSDTDSSDPSAALFSGSASSGLWILPDTELIAGIDYALSPGAQIAFGSTSGDTLTVDFEAPAGGGSNWAMDLMASRASDDVKAKLQDE